MTELITRLTATHRSRLEDRSANHMSEDLIGRVLHCGIETRRDPRLYYWDSMRRGGDPRHPFAVFQYTLEGWGCYATGNTIQRVQPGAGFLAIVPSESRYYLPPESASWTFFYLLVYHDYVIPRLAETVQRRGAVMTITPENLLLQRAAGMFEAICQRTFPDNLAAEQSIFDFMIEYERHACQQTGRSQSQRQQLLQSARQQLTTHLTQNVSVEELADRHGMTRSNFSHYFRSVTGISPAKYLADLRVQEVSRRLVQTNQTLKQIAAETGYADANHLCKAFRRTYHMSPGHFRKQRGLETAQ